MKASIIIPVFNRKDDLAQCLTALLCGSASRDNFEVIVVDDGSTDNVETWLREEYPCVHLFRTGGNCGPSHARNLGARYAKGHLLVFLDSDTVPEKHWLERLFAYDDGNTVIIGHTLDYETGRVQGGPRRATFLGKSLPCRADRANTGPSCNLAVPRNCFDAVGGFDERIPYYFEDSFLCIQSAKKGFLFRYAHDAVVRHKGSAKRVGEAIRMQEHNSVYAMMGLYHPSLTSVAAFSCANGIWLVLRLVWWTLHGRQADARLLATGWWTAIVRYLREHYPRHNNTPG